MEVYFVLDLLGTDLLALHHWELYFMKNEIEERYSQTVFIAKMEIIKQLPVQSTENGMLNQKCTTIMAGSTAFSTKELTGKVLHEHCFTDS